MYYHIEVATYMKRFRYLPFMVFFACCLTACQGPQPAPEETETETAAQAETEAPAPEQKSLPEALRELRVQYGNEFTFGMKIPETGDKALEEEPLREAITEKALEETATEKETLKGAIEEEEAPEEESMGREATEVGSLEEDTAEAGTSEEGTPGQGAESSDKKSFGVTPESPENVTIRTLRDYYELPGCPLPKMSGSILLLEKQVRRLTESYDGEWSVYVKNLQTGDQFVIHDEPMKSASVMKLFIMGAVHEAVNQKELEQTQEVEDLLYNMIVYSSNGDANRLLKLLGKGSYEDGIEYVNRYIRRHYQGETHEYNGFSDPETYVDPDRTNQVSARDCGELLEQIYRRTLGSRQFCNEIEEMMLKQDTRYKIPAGIPEEASVGNKSGEMDIVENDVAVVYGEKSDYILCVLSSDWEDKNAAIDHIGEISSAVYQFFDDDGYYEFANRRDRMRSLRTTEG